MAENKSLAATYRGESPWVVFLLGLSLALFAAGMFRPFTQVTKLWLFENEISVYSGVITLASEREYFLFGVLLVFTVIFPLVKNACLLTLWLKGGLTKAGTLRLHRFVAHLGKWSMLDVFVTAVLVLLVRSGGVAAIKVREGLLLFFASVVLTMVVSIWIGSIAERQLGE